jgi:fructosamine-3-kinase
VASSNTDRALIADVLGQEPVCLEPLAGGCVARVYRVGLADGGSLAAKVSTDEVPTLDIEAFMLGSLCARATLPVPRVVASTARVLVMEFIKHSGGASEPGLRELAQGLGELHGVCGPAFGFERDTLIGPLVQPNAQMSSWREFYAEHRLRHFAGVARRQGGLSGESFDRCLWAADRIGDWIDDDEPPALVHGDLWAGNVLWRDGRVAALIDPAIHFAHREVELAFMDLFGSFGSSFWDRYHELRPIRDGFWQTRRHVYRLYPLLVHVALFGGSYGSMLSSELDALGVPG